MGSEKGAISSFILVGLFRLVFLQASAHAKFVNFATNLSPVLYFAWHGDVLWEYSIPMGICNLAGAYVGTHLAIQKGNKFIRGLFLAVLILLIGRLAWEYR